MLSLCIDIYGLERANDVGMHVLLTDWGRSCKGHVLNHGS
jgi:hypothetical protein